MFGIPAYRGQVHYGHVMQMMSMASTIMAAKGAFALRGFLCPESCSVDWSRNQLLHAAIKDGSDWLLMNDADTFYPRCPEALRMIIAGQEAGAAVIAAPVKMRGRGEFNVFQSGEEPRLVKGEEFLGKVVPCDRIGTAYMAVNVPWFEKHWPEQPWFVTQHLPGPKPVKIGEDVSFCDGVRARGGTILVDGRFEPHHVGA